ncbi:hypothetical protein BDF14DRAFT_1702226, partial [Spinellus fusiger]
DKHKKHLIHYFDENQRATIQDAVDDLKRSFEEFEIKKSRVAEFMKDECNISLKRIPRHPAARNSVAQPENCAIWVEEWTVNRINYLQNCVFLDESGFYINM